MIPVRISLSGFMSYRDEQCLNFEGAPLWVLSGPNGVGKSTIFDAITFVLFGEYRDQKQNLSDLVNHNSNKAVVVFEFRLGDDLFRVTRTIKKNGATTRCAYSFVPASNGRPERFDPIPETEGDDGFRKWVDTKVGLNYEVFTSSILLQQNKSDKLLDANTEKRFKILTKLIDLSRYIELEKRAATRQKSWKDKSTALGGQLQSLLLVSERDLAAANERVSKAIDAAIKADELVNRLTIMYGQSQRWDTLNRELQVNNVEVGKKQNLIDQAEVITQKYQRYQALVTAIPILTNIYDARQRLAQSVKIEARHQGEYDHLTEPLRQAIDRQGELAQQHQQQDYIIQSLTDERQAANDRMLALAPTLNLLNQIQDLEEKQAEQTKTLNSFPADVETQLTTAEMKEVQETEAKNALAWLKIIAKTRTDLQETVKLKGQLTQRHRALEQVVSEAKQAQQKAKIAFGQAGEVERSAHTKQVEAETLLREAREKNSRFNQVVGDKKCRYCGQLLTPEHIESEKVQLAQELEECKQSAQAAKDEHKLTSDQLKAANEALGEANQKADDAETALGELDNHLRQHNLDIPKFLVALQEAYITLPSSYQSRIASICPDSPERWGDTTYPSREEIVQVEQEGNQQKTTHADVERLRMAKNQRSQAKALLKSIETDLANVRGKLPPDAEKAWGENEAARHAQADTEAALKDARDRLSEIKGDQEKNNNSISELRKKQAEAQNGVSSERSRQKEINTNLESYTRQLDPGWLPQLSELDQKTIHALETERETLAQYDGLYRGLDAARQTVERLSVRIGELKQLIDEIPGEARVTPENVNSQLVVAQTANSYAGNEKNQAVLALQQLETRKRERAEVETKKLAADRKVHLYGILAEKFGEQGIQQALINRAEIEIVNKANDVLYNLSAGRWSLALREEGKNKKALDVVVYDSKTGGNDPIPIVLASGSQRFRIAISLALAIGQYVRHESHRIESVIIDEGFGSLDKIGRDDTIQELRNLHQQLERIILVSHQEEFYGTFSTGYGIDVVDGASRVTLIER
jgi:exonuclease SbcC